VERGRAACRELGAALARAGCDLLVFSSSAAYIEHEVVHGYAGASTVAAPGRIVARPTKNNAVSFDLSEDTAVEVQVEPDTGGEWELPYYRSMLRSDGILLVGGSQSTRIAGIMAIVMEVPLLPVATFGGGASQVWVNLDKQRNDVVDTDITAMGQPWMADSATRLVAGLLAQRQRRYERMWRARQSARRESWSGGVGLVVALAALCASLVTIPLSDGGGPAQPRSLALLLAGPMIAAIAGGIIRNSFGTPAQWGSAAVRGLGAGVVVVPLYILSQLLTVADLFVDFDARRLLFFVIPLGFAAGFTFDLIYERLRAADDLVLSRMNHRDKVSLHSPWN
jgi:hypothetical protein